MELITIIGYIGVTAKAGKHVLGLINDINHINEERRDATKTLTELLGNEFQQALKLCDEDYETILENLKVINGNNQSMQLFTSQVYVSLMAMMLRFENVDEQFCETRKKLKEGFEKLEILINETEIKAVLSGLTTFIEDFTVKLHGLMEMSHAEGTASLKNTLKYFGTATTPQSALSLHSLLNRVLDGRYSIPKNADDEVAFAALFLLTLGTNTYVDIFKLLLSGYEYLALDHYSRSEVDEYNEYYSIITITVQEFRHRLYGVGGQTGLIGRVIQELETVAQLGFIKEEKRQVVDILLKKIEEFEKTRKIFPEINYVRQQPNSRILCDFTECDIKTPFLKWRDSRTVQYAMQYVKNGTYSPVSDWKLITIHGDIWPKLDIGDAPPDTKRMIFRRFDQEKPQLVSIISDPSQTEIRDIDRDLYDAVVERNKNLAHINALTLINHGADITATFEEGRQAIHAATNAGNLQTISDLIAKGADVNGQDNKGYGPLHIAAESGNNTLVQALIERGADVGLKTQLNWTALHAAANYDHAKTIQLLLHSKNVDPNSRAEGGFTPLHMAVITAQTRAVDVLCADQRTDVNAQSETMTTPLHFAVLNSNIQIVQTLLGNKKCDVNSKAQGGLTSLHFAVAAGNIDLVDLLVNHSATDVNSKSDEGWSPLHLAVTLKIDDATQLLLKTTETKVNLQGKDLLTPLHLASRAGQTAIVSELLNRGSLLDVLDSRNFTPLQYAVERDHIEIVKLLVDKGAVFRSDILEVAALTNNFELVKYLILNEMTLIDGQTPLHKAASLGDVDIVRYVLEKFPDVNAKDNFDRTPLHYAILSGSKEVVDYLLDKGADKKLTNCEDSSLQQLYFTKKPKKLHFFQKMFKAIGYKI